MSSYAPTLPHQLLIGTIDALLVTSTVLSEHVQSLMYRLRLGVRLESDSSQGCGPSSINNDVGADAA